MGNTGLWKGGGATRKAPLTLSTVVFPNLTLAPMDLRGHTVASVWPDNLMLCKKLTVWVSLLTRKSGAGKTVWLVPALKDEGLNLTPTPSTHEKKPGMMVDTILARGKQR